MPEDGLGRVERRMYLTAAMTGMRQGELLALRWRVIDWPALRPIPRVAPVSRTKVIGELYPWYE